MSRASAKVKFPDGTIKYGIYDGTSDVYFRPLFNTLREAWDAYSNDSMDDEANIRYWDDSYETVEIANDYGGGTTHIGRATKNKIVSDVVEDFMIQVKEGLPDWWNEDKKS